MLDKRSYLVLQLINGKSQSGDYKVITFEEIIKSLPEKFSLDENGLKIIINDLSEKQMLTIKYMDDKSMCVASMPKGRMYFEERAENKVVSKRTVMKWLISGLFCFFGAFLGAMLAVLIF